MPKIGDIVKGDQIGRREKGRYRYMVCPTCGIERWVTYTGAQFTQQTPVLRCNPCRLKAHKVWLPRPNVQENPRYHRTSP